MSRYSHIPVNWFPGHMAKSTRLIQENLARAKNIIEVRDARIPLSSENHTLKDLIQRSKKKHVIVLNKHDLSDRRTTHSWKSYLQESNPQAPLFTSLKPRDSGQWGAEQRKKTQSLLELIRTCHSAAETGSDSSRPVISMVVGFPNVGKSTLINHLVGRRRASVAPKPAWTRGVQLFRIRMPDPTDSSLPPGPFRDAEGETEAPVKVISEHFTNRLAGHKFQCTTSTQKQMAGNVVFCNGLPRKETVRHVWLLDTPGVMVPARIESEQGLKLMVCGCVADHVLEHFYLLAGEYVYYLLTKKNARRDASSGWHGALKLETVPNTYEHLLREIGKRFGKKDETTQARVLVSEFRKGNLGEYTLDEIPM
ncbi:mitochondrial ribosome-associated GTPase 1-like [Schistocerca gregaria]|uniref:mitochondrial ribosome-associated GTPase 1-like n=1 Tax=Schistocerca gregaria TaxID=7010 RepID=UPI00211EDEA0|nr:mitochondrial ribosome-associated GTPase 1-like [Schistocerca gregaria]